MSSTVIFNKRAIDLNIYCDKKNVINVFMNYYITIIISLGAIGTLHTPSRRIYRFKEFTQVHHDEYFTTESVSVLIFLACI